jgi:hypothetical protein
MQKMINNKNTINFFKKVKWQFSTTKKMRNSSKTKNWDYSKGFGD